ncbi:MAG: YdcF family protein [Scytolyngbya sp. HA4215-MV1]|jgi:uncharacterized SAM-binding protein YcdF (DUF218 family)|nr:YdcF family protein [Scytolyngbya sp. HA4215-MV1]
MFLFLSKLLPLFIYPLGLACLLMIVALVSLWSRPRLAAGAIALALIYLLFGSNGWVAMQLARSLEWQNLPKGELPAADAIVVLGGSTISQNPPRPWVEILDEGDRVLYAAKLYRQGKATKVILSGGRIDWRMSGPSESSDMATLIETMGVPQAAILQDPTSLNTYENAVNVKQIMATQGIRRILLVTSAFHMPRSLRIFKKLGIEAIAAPTDFSVTQQSIDELQSTPEGTLLNIIPDVEKLRRTTRVLKEYVGMAIYWLKGWI